MMEFSFTDEDEKKLISDVYYGKVAKKNLPESLYLAIIATLLTALGIGFAKPGKKGGKAKETSKNDANKITKSISALKSEIFGNNPAKTGELFNKNHPYFDVKKEDKKLAQRNFDLPIPKNTQDYFKVKNIFNKESVASLEFGYGEATEELLNELRENVYVFSSAKVYQEIEALQGLRLAENGEVLTFNEFETKALQLLGNYNKSWLQAEYNTALAEAETARKFNDAIADQRLFPMLKYVTVGDDHVSAICAPLNGMTLKVSDPIWNSFVPPNHFNCRCVLEQVEEQ